MSKAHTTRFFLTWHRRFGIVLAALLLLLSLTGIALNHSSDLGLDRQWIKQDWLLDLYGIEAPSISAAYQTGKHWFIEIDGRLYFDNEPIANHADLHGAISHNELLIVQTEQRLLLLTQAGELVETIYADLPKPLISLGIDAAGQPAINSADGIFAADHELLNWNQIAEPPIRWSKASRAPAGLVATVRQRHRSEMLNWERLVLDLHSGNLLGISGRWLLDLIAIAISLLALSGIVIWWRIHPPRRAKKG